MYVCMYVQRLNWSKNDIGGTCQSAHIRGQPAMKTAKRMHFKYKNNMRALSCLYAQLRRLQM